VPRAGTRDTALPMNNAAADHEDVTRQAGPGLALVSAGVTAWQIVLMQALGWTGWYHFAYLVIALALLGFGASGTVLTLARERLVRSGGQVARTAAALSAAGMALAPVIAGGGTTAPDIYLLFVDARQAALLAVACAALAIPFFLSGLAIGVVLTSGAARAGRLYAWNLAGSGAGGVAGWLLLSVLQSSEALAIVALLPLCGAFFFRPGQDPRSSGRRKSVAADQEKRRIRGWTRDEQIGRVSDPPIHGQVGDLPYPKGHASWETTRQESRARRVFRLLTSAATPGCMDTAGSRFRTIMNAGPMIFAAVAVIAAFAFSGGLRPSQFKDISRLLDLPDALVVLDEPHPRGRLQIVETPAFRTAPPTSLRFTGEFPVQSAVLIDGNLRGSLLADHAAVGSLVPFDHALESVAWAIGPRQNVMLLESGGEGFAAWALSKGAESVVCVESHPAVARALARVLPDGATVGRREPRDALAADGAPFDLIRFPTAGSFGGSAGMHAVGEQFLFTTEAFSAAHARLSDPGVIVASVWTEQPERNAPRLLATIMDGLRRADVREPPAHVAAIRSWNATTFVAKRSPLTGADVAAIRAFCERLEFDPLVLRGEVVEAGERFHEAPGSALAQQVRAILADDIAAAEAAAGGAFRFGSATDDRPYFSQFLKISHLPRLARDSGWRSAPFVEMGYLVVALSAPLLLVAALALVIAPLSRVGWSEGSRWATALFATGLGLGFMLVEIGLIARLTLFLGGSLSAAATVLTTLLLAAGAGSAFSQRFSAAPRTLSRIALGVAAVAIALGAVTSLAPAGWSAPAAIRMVVAGLAIAPAAFVMGMAFPTLLRLLEATEPSHVPWAWAVNGCASVVAPSLAVLIAVNAGHGAVFGAAAAAYVVAALAAIGMRPGASLR
jgi:hypothetical protein